MRASNCRLFHIPGIFLPAIRRAKLGRGIQRPQVNAEERGRRTWGALLGTLYHGLRSLFQFPQRGVIGVIVFSCRFGHARFIHFLFYAREERLVGFLS